MERKEEMFDGEEEYGAAERRHEMARRIPSKLVQPLYVWKAEIGRPARTKLMRIDPPTEAPDDADGDEVAADVDFGVVENDGVCVVDGVLVAVWVGVMVDVTDGVPVVELVMDGVGVFEEVLVEVIVDVAVDVTVDV